jgi:hypothetical protein
MLASCCSFMHAGRSTHEYASCTTHCGFPLYSEQPRSICSPKQILWWIVCTCSGVAGLLMDQSPALAPALFESLPHSHGHTWREPYQMTNSSPSPAPGAKALDVWHELREIGHLAVWTVTWPTRVMATDSDYIEQGHWQWHVAWMHIT